ncbi:MAG: hypothetical protein AB2L20_11665 [Mangrovibacterium sp.]
MKNIILATLLVVLVGCSKEDNTGSLMGNVYFQSSQSSNKNLCQSSYWIFDDIGKNPATEQIVTDLAAGKLKYSDGSFDVSHQGEAIGSGMNTFEDIPKGNYIVVTVCLVPGEIRYSYKKVAIDNLTIADKTFLAIDGTYQEWDANW